MDVLSEYAERWMFSVNCRKSAVMVYGGLQSHPARNWWLGGALVAERSSYRYLGVILQADGSFSEQVEDLLKRGRMRLGVLKHRFLRGGRLPGQLARQLTMAHMFGILEYGAAVWCCQLPVTAGQLDALWNKACRAVVGAHRYTAAAAVLGDLELLPLHIRRAVLVANLYYKVASAPSGSILAEVFRARRRQFLGSARLPLQFMWLEQVESALQVLGLSAYFLDLEEDRSLEQHLPRETWKAKVALGAKTAMRTWWAAEVVRHAPYMAVLQRACPDGPRRQRYTESRAGRWKGFLAMLRAGALPLRQCAPASRFARFDRASADERCRLCSLDEDESLVHFLFQCPSLAPLRRLADPLWARLSPDLDGIARVLSGFSGTPHGFLRMTQCWHRMWLFRNDCLKLEPLSFGIRWPGLAQPSVPVASAARSVA